MVNDLTTKDKQPEMNKGYPFFGWRRGIPITDEDDKTQNKDDEIVSTHKGKEYDDITENGEK